MTSSKTRTTISNNLLSKLHLPRAPILSCTSWWWLLTGLVSQPFCKQLISNFVKNNYLLKNFPTSPPKFHFENSKCKIYFAEFLEKLRYWSIDYCYTKHI